MLARKTRSDRNAWLNVFGLVSTAAVTLVLGSAFAELRSAPSEVAPTPLNLGATLSGTVALSRSLGEQALVELPEFKVWLKGLEQHPTETDEFGTFAFRLLPPGEYQVCWGDPNEDPQLSGWKHGCGPLIEVPAGETFAGIVSPEPLGRCLALRVAESGAGARRSAGSLEHLEVTFMADPGVSEPTPAKINGRGWAIQTQLPQGDLVVRGNWNDTTAEMRIEDGKSGILPADQALVFEPTAPSLTPAEDPTVDSCGDQFLTRRSEHEEDDAVAYYQAIDPTHERTTLGAWWGVNGFDPSDGSGGVRLAYLNHNDLGFGRDLSCIERPNRDIACWVSNYGGPDQNPANADLAAAGDASQAIATVVMEWRELSTFLPEPATIDKLRDLGFASQELDALQALNPDTDLPASLMASRVVTFYAYQGGLANSPRLHSADLDGCDEKFLPGLCLNCHGGTLSKDLQAGVSVGDLWRQRSSFRELDASALRYPAGRRTPNEREWFTMDLFNRLVAKTEPAPGILELIDGWYAGGTTEQNTEFVPIGWDDEQDERSLYSRVIGTSCRTCHVAFQNQGPTWRTIEEFETFAGIVDLYICDDGDMPHAAVTRENLFTGDGIAELQSNPITQGFPSTCPE